MTSPIKCLRMKADIGKVNKKILAEAEELIKELGDAGDDVARAVQLRDTIAFRLQKKKQQTALQIKTIQEMEEQVAKAADDPTGKIVLVKQRKVRGKTVVPEVAVSRMTLAMLSRLTYDPTGTFTGPNVEILWKTTKGQAEALFSEGLERFARRRLGFSQDVAGLRSLVKELFGETSNDNSARTISQAWKRVDDFLVREMQRYGGNIVKREDWGLPQYHDAKRVGATSFDEWKEFIIPKLNREKMIDDVTGLPFSDKKLEEALSEVYDTIATHGLSKLEPGGARVGRKLANRHSDSRFLVFRNSDAWLEYNEKYGTGGDIYELLTGHIDQMSREIAILKTLGPNPDATVRWMTDTIRKHNADMFRGGKFNSVRDTAGSKMVEKLYDVVSGRLNSPATAWWAEANQFVRNGLVSSQLGGAWVAALTDLNFQRLTGSFNKLNVVRQQNQLLKNFFSAAGKEEALRLATKLSLGAEQWSGTAIGQQRFLGEVTGPRTSRLMADTILRGSLLTPWTYAGRHSFKQEILMSIADRMNKRWSALEPEFQRGLQRYDINEADWNNIRKQGNFFNEQGQLIFYPEAATRAGYRAEAEKVLRFAFTEAEYAVPSASSLTQLATTGGTQAGTFFGEMIRNVGLYKSFPLTVIMTHVARGTLYAGTTPASKLRYMLDMVVTTTIFGGLVLQMKQIQQGKDPIEVFNAEHGPEFLAAAMLQGGGLGIFGDFMFADQNRFGYGPLQTLAGPVLGSLFPDTMKLTVGNLQELIYGEDTKAGRDLTQYLKRYTPGVSLWYGRLALERLLFERLQDILDPNANQSFREKYKRAQADYGQDWWWAPGETAPSRRPDLGAIVK